jgi:clan AA aspartic protease
MIQGRFGDKGELFFEIELIIADGTTISVEGMLDTGFTEFLAINKQDVNELNWFYYDKEELLTAQGLAIFDIYLGKILLDGREFEVPVFAGDDIQEILLGSEWLKRFDLIAKYREGVLTLG